MFPEIVEQIFAYCDHSTLITIRSTCCDDRDFLDRHWGQKRLCVIGSSRPVISELEEVDFRRIPIISVVRNGRHSLHWYRRYIRTVTLNLCDLDPRSSFVRLLPRLSEKSGVCIDRATSSRGEGLSWPPRYQLPRIAGLRIKVGSECNCGGDTYSSTMLHGSFEHGADDVSVTFQGQESMQMMEEARGANLLTRCHLLSNVVTRSVLRLMLYCFAACPLAL